MNDVFIVIWCICVQKHFPTVFLTGRHFFFISDNENYIIGQTKLISWFSCHVFWRKKNRWHFPPFNLRGKMIWEVFPFMVWYTIDFILFGMLVWKFYKIKKITTQEWNIVKIENKLHLKLITMSQLSTICATKWSASVIQIYQRRINRSQFIIRCISRISL